MPVATTGAGPTTGASVGPAPTGVSFTDNGDGTSEIDWVDPPGIDPSPGIRLDYGPTPAATEGFFDYDAGDQQATPGNDFPITLNVLYYYKIRGYFGGLLGSPATTQGTTTDSSPPIQGGQPFSSPMTLTVYVAILALLGM